MNNHRYTPEFKDEAVRQVLERGYTVAEEVVECCRGQHDTHVFIFRRRPIKRMMNSGGNRLGKNRVIKA